MAALARLKQRRVSAVRVSKIGLFHLLRSYVVGGLVRYQQRDALSLLNLKFGFFFFFFLFFADEKYMYRHCVLIL